MAFSYFSSTNSIKPVWYLAPAFVLPLTLATTATVGRRLLFGQAVLYGSRAISLLLGISSLVLGVSIFFHVHVIKDLTTVLEPGILGGFLLLLLNILYIPNAIVATLGYFSGTGFAVGSGTLISPTSFHLHTIPAFPLLGALPTGKFIFALIGIVVVMATGAILASWTIALNARILFQSLVIFIVITAAVGFAGSGALLTDAMSAVGVSPWKFILSLTLELVLGAFLALFLPRLGRRT